MADPIELDAWNRWWRSRGEPGVRALLMTLWDPIGVAGIPEAKDEYDSYLLPVARMLRDGASGDDIARYLHGVRADAMGLPGVGAETDIGVKIRTWYDGETGQYQDPTRNWWE